MATTAVASLTGGMELHKLHVLVLQAGARRHGGSVARAGVRRRAAEVRAPRAARRQDRVLGLESDTTNVQLQSRLVLMADYQLGVRVYNQPSSEG